LDGDAELSEAHRHAAPPGEPMAQLTFRCPYTNKLILSGIELFADNLKGMSEYPISVDCPHCSNRHHGFIADGCLIEASPALELSEP
jgi:hypothetical protein